MRVMLTGNTCFKIANFRDGLVRALIANGFEVVVLAPWDRTRDKLIAMGCRVVDLPMDRNGTSPKAEAALMGRMFHALNKFQPEIIFSFTIKNNIYAGLVSRWFGIPFVPNVTGLGPAFNDAGLLNRLIRFLYRLAFSKAKRVFFQNPEDLEIFLGARLIDSERSELLPGSGVDLMRFAACPMPADDSGLIFLFVSRLLWDKGIGLFVEAAQAIKAENPSYRFQVVGPLDEDSRSGISPEQLQVWVDEGTIEYLGELADVRPALIAAHCIVLPTWYREGTPRVLLEAAAIGRPAITTDTPGCREAVVDGETGLLCKPRDPQSLTTTLQKFAAMSSHERSEMGTRARDRAVAVYDEARVVEAYMRLLPGRD